MRRALRDLLEVAERYVIKIESDRVTITDDLERTQVYLANGKKEKHVVGATKFETTTEWQGRVLVQHITSGVLHLSQVFVPTDDGQALFVSFRLEKPELAQPVKPVMRAYSRVE